jgi:glutaryl-CoA dehydrogenase
MSANTYSPIVAAAGGSFLLETRTPAEVFTPEDFNEEQRQIAATVAQFARDEILANMAAIEAKQPGVVQALMRKAGELGFASADVPEEYGGMGMDKVTSTLITDHMSVVASFSTAFGSHVGISTLPLVWYGSPDQKQRYLPKLATCEWIGGYGLSEASSGSDAMNIRTHATLSPDGAHYILNGEKMWITNGSIADVAVIWAKVQDEAVPTGSAVRGFLVETARPGFHAHEIHGKWSLRASLTSGLSLQDVHIPAANLLPGSIGLKSPLMCLNQARYGIGWGAIGAAMACYDTALQYARARKQFHGQPIASHQLIQQKLVWMVSEISKAQLLSLHVGRLKDAGTAGHEHISLAKRNNVWMALESARMARDILGANGITDDYPIMRHMMNLESVNTYEGTHDIHTLILGQHITGIAAY